nr:MAG TPA: hypothetical protein [Caudoviricetes sp.]
MKAYVYWCSWFNLMIYNGIVANMNTMNTLRANSLKHALNATLKA